MFPRSIDQGVDVGCKMIMDDNFKPITVIFQAKLHKKTIGRRVVDQVRGSLGSKDRDEGQIGFVITNSLFSKDAKDSSKRDYPKVELINGEQLVKLMKKHQIGIKIEKGSLFVNITFFKELINLIYKTKGCSEKIFVKVIDGIPQQTV